VKCFVSVLFQNVRTSKNKTAIKLFHFSLISQYATGLKASVSRKTLRDCCEIPCCEQPSRRSLRSVGTNHLVVPTPYPADCRLLVAELFRSPARRHGMTSRQRWHQQNHWPHFVVSSRHTCSASLFLTTCWTST